MCTVAQKRKKDKRLEKTCHMTEFMRMIFGCKDELVSENILSQ